MITYLIPPVRHICLPVSVYAIFAAVNAPQDLLVMQKLNWRIYHAKVTGQIVQKLKRRETKSSTVHMSTKGWQQCTSHPIYIFAHTHGCAHTQYKSPFWNATPHIHICWFNFDALAQGNAYKPTKEPINYRGPGGDRTHDIHAYIHTYLLV